MKIIGIDAGGTWIKATRFSEDLREEQRVKIKSGASVSKEAYFTSIVEGYRALATEESTNVGLAIPGVFSKDRETICYAANIKGMSVNDQPVDIQNEVKKILGVEKLSADNDAKCAALAEWKLGWGEGRKELSLLHVTWGTGIGSGFITQGESQPGWEGGHIPLAWEEKAFGACNCGSLLDLEARVAVPQLVAQAKALWQSRRLPTVMQENDFADEKETPKKLVIQAEAGDPLASTVITSGLCWFARGLLVMSIISYPDIVTIGGAMMDSDWLLHQLQQHVQAEASGFPRRVLSADIIHRAKLGNDAGMIGAALLSQRVTERT